jgi:hypothetical protein
MISINNEDGTYDAVYCHFDGYPEGVGSVGDTLHKHYVSEEKIKQLIAGGDMSCIKPSIEDCEFYTKRGEDFHNYKKLPLNLLRESAEDVGCEYLYMFYKGEWNCEEL